MSLLTGTPRKRYNKMEANVKIKWEGKEEEVTLRQLTWGEHKKIRERSIIIKEYNDLPMQFFNADMMGDLKIVSAIVKAPFDKKLENIEKLTENDRNKLLILIETLDGEETDIKPSS